VLAAHLLDQRCDFSLTIGQAFDYAGSVRPTLQRASISVAALPAVPAASVRRSRHGRALTALITIAASGGIASDHSRRVVYNVIPYSN
jgi:hypothetical protein